MNTGIYVYMYVRIISDPRHTWFGELLHTGLEWNVCTFIAYSVATYVYVAIHFATIIATHN